MEIRFSPSFLDRHPPPCSTHVLHLVNNLHALGTISAQAKLSSAKDRTVRFQLVWNTPAIIPSRITNREHEHVIAALFNLDPLAQIRTSRANYRDREDYLKQMRAGADP